MVRFNPARLGVFAFAVAAPAAASITPTLDKLDASDGIPLPPSHLVVIDLQVEVTADDAWAATGIYGEPANGVRIAFAQDPNSGGPLFTAPGADNRFVTFFSKPRDRDAANRFGTGAAILPLGYSGPPIPRLRPTLVDVGAAEMTQGPLGRSGYVARVALDLSWADNPAFRQDSTNIVVALTAPSNSVPLFRSQYLNIGTFVASRNNFSRAFNWGVYGIIPEPATLALAWLISAALRFSRR